MGNHGKLTHAAEFCSSCGQSPRHGRAGRADAQSLLWGRDKGHVYVGVL